MGSNVIVTIVIVVYLLFMLWIGWYSSTKISINIDFMMAGRCLRPLLMTGTLAITETGGGGSLGVVQNGMSGFGFSVSWYITTMRVAFIILSFVAPKFRASTVKTIPEYFRRRHGKSCGIMTTVIMFLPLVGLTAGQLIASTVILSTMLSIDYQAAVIIVAVVVTVHSIMGGLWSVTLTDFAQVFLTVTGMIIVVPFAIDYAEERGNTASNIPKGTLSLFQGHDLSGIISFAITYIATFSAGQEAVSRFYAAGDEKAARGGAWLAALVNSIYAFVPIILSIITLALINMDKFSPAQFESVGVCYALPVLVINTMSALICGFLFAGITSATMPSFDSDLPGVSSIFANDIYKAALKPDASSQSAMKATKIVMCLVGLASMLTAPFNTQSIAFTLTFCFILRATDSFSPYVMGHYWKKTSIAGTTASLTAGTIVVVYLEYASRGILFGIKFSQSIIPDLAAALICFIIFSLVMLPRKETAKLTSEEDDQIRI